MSSFNGSLKVEDGMDERFQKVIDG